jgi:hypothetical protein
MHSVDKLLKRILRRVMDNVLVPFHSGIISIRSGDRQAASGHELRSHRKRPKDLFARTSARAGRSTRLQAGKKFKKKPGFSPCGFDLDRPSNPS